MSLFEAYLSVPIEELEFRLARLGPVPWAPFILNPRRLRGSDFLMRWSQGVWSEERLIQAVNQSGKYFALPYGPSGTAPSDDVREFELYFERLEKAGRAGEKRPNLLIFPISRKLHVDNVVEQLGGTKELPFTEEQHLQELISMAVMAVECENSLWKALQMPHYGVEMKPQKRLGGLPGMAKTAVLPTVIIKEEDRGPLNQWQQLTRIPIHIWHAFYDLAFGM